MSKFVNNQTMCAPFEKEWFFCWNVYLHILKKQRIPHGPWQSIFFKGPIVAGLVKQSPKYHLNFFILKSTVISGIFNTHCFFSFIVYFLLRYSWKNNSDF